MAKFLKVFADKTLRKKDSWNWNCSEPSRKQKGLINVLYSAQGFDTKAIALKRAQAHNKTLIKPLRIKLYDAKGRYQAG